MLNVALITYAQPDADGEVRGFTYPGEALLGMKIQATGELSGDVDTTAVVERSTVKVYNTRPGGGWTDGTADSHAWAVYDTLANGHVDHPEYPDIDADPTTIQPIYGCGVNKDNIDYESFRSWSEYANRPSADDPSNFGSPYGIGYKLNIVFDTLTPAWDAIMRICQEGRGITYPFGSIFYALVDKPVANADITQLFCMGNINLESFSQQWLDKSKKATLIEVTYWDEDNNYDRTQFVIRTSDWDTTAELSTPVKLALHGTTTYNQAFAIGTYRLNSNELLSQIVGLETDMEMLQAQVGDVVRVQHRSLTGDGGRVKSYTAGSNTVTLDKTVTVAAGTTYELFIQHSDGTLERKTYTGVADTDTLFFGGDAWTTNPAKYDNWAFGPSGEATKLFRIMDIDLAGDYKRRVVCLEYTADAYKTNPYTTDTDAETAGKVGAGKYAPGADLSVINVGKIAPDLNQPTLVTFNTAANLRLVEVISRNRSTGEYESSVVVSWDMDQGENWGMWDIRFRDVDGTDLDWQGEWVAGGSYDQYEKVERGGFAFISLVDNNTTEPFV